MMMNLVYFAIEPVPVQNGSSRASVTINYIKPMNRSITVLYTWPAGVAGVTGVTDCTAAVKRNRIVKSNITSQFVRI